MTPARAHRLKHEAEDIAQREQDAYGGVCHEILAQLHRDRLRLKEIRSILEKEALKRELVPTYAPYIEGVLSQGIGAQDEVFSTLLVWSVDAGLYEDALKMAAYALQHGLDSPDAHKRTTAEFLAEEISDRIGRNNDVEAIHRPILENVRALVAGHSIVDQVRAKLERVSGLAALDDGDYSVAIDHFRQALTLNPSAGCKRQLAEAEKLQQAKA